MLCEYFPGVCFPHELLDYDQDDYAGILLSLEIGREIKREQKEHAESNKGKTAGRKGKALAAKRPPARSRKNPKRPTKG